MNTVVSDIQSAGRAHAVRGAAFAQLARRTFGAMSLEQARIELEVRPDRVAALRRPGLAPYKILLFGGGVLEGVGLRDHDLGLPGRLADVLAAQTRHGIELNIVVDLDPTSSRALTGLVGLRLNRFDAIVVVLGERAASARVDADLYRGALVGLTKTLMAASAPAAGVFVYDSARAVLKATGADSDSRTAAAATRQLETAAQLYAVTDRVRFSELSPAPGAPSGTNHFTDSAYQDWAERIAERLRPALGERTLAPEQDQAVFFRNGREDERYRQRALDSLRLRSGQPMTQLAEELQHAKRTYNAATAAINIIDRDTQWPLASTANGTPIPRAQSFCDFAIQSDGLTLINDTWRDPRTASNPRAQGDAAIRFYAGFPLHSFDGYRVGTVCMWDHEPRKHRPRELEGLREAAARIEQLLWTQTMKGSAA